HLDAARHLNERPGLRTFQALRHRNFRLFWFGQLGSLIGTWMQSIAQSWLVLTLSKSSFTLGLVSAMGMLPVLFFAIPAGALIDRIDKRRLLVGTQTFQMLLALALGVLASTHTVQVGHIIVLAGLLGLSNEFHMPGRQSFVAELVDRTLLLNAIALNSSAFNAARIIGPAIAGLLISAVGVAGCFYLNSLSFIAVIVGLLLMDLSHTPRPARSSSMSSDVLQGLRYIGQNRDMLLLIVLGGVCSVFGLPYLMLMPVFAQGVLAAGAKGYGLLMSATGAGALIGALGLASLGDARHKGRVVLAAGIGFVACINLFSASRSLLLCSILLLGIGFCMVAQTATTNSLLQTLAPDELRGRVMSVFSVLFVGFVPIGSLQAGFVAQNYGAPTALVLGAAIMALAIILTVVIRPQVLTL
ncbi:MAG: MFS transporter, partial [candidate division WOR-3 bacterium]